MRVTLIDYTGSGHHDPALYSAALLSFTKNTRVTMGAGEFQAALGRPYHALLEDVRYAAATIQSSWEFINYVFSIEGVSRAVTHQLVRTRTATYAQQTMQILNVSGWTAYKGKSVADSRDASFIYDEVMHSISSAYDELVAIDGVKIEDARGVLPTNILTNIIMRTDLRTVCNLLRTRLGPRNTGEIVDMCRLMRAEVLRVHPWTAEFVDRDTDKVADELRLEIAAVVDAEQRTRLNKLVDNMLTVDTVERGG